MKRAFLIALLLPVIGWADTSDFDNASVGELPVEWLGGVTGRGHAQWLVATDDSAPSQPHVLKQAGEGTFPWCVLQDVTLTNGLVEVMFKTVAGREDQAAGLMWRVQDGDNYYVCRANVLEDNVVLYKIVKGKRTALDIVGRKGGYGVKVNVPRGQWNTLRVEFNGDEFVVVFNGDRQFTVKDKTFMTAGKVGVWTKADSVTLFDNFWVGK